jgi:hypothetical protein
MSLKKRVEYYFRVAVGIGGMTQVLADFLKDRNTLLTEREKVIGAAAAFWLPFALLHKGDYSKADLQRCAREAIYKLRMHINYIAETFGLENPKDVFNTPVMPYSPLYSDTNGSQGLSQTSSSVNETINPISQQASSTEVEYEQKNLINHHDDDTLHEMFN